MLRFWCALWLYWAASLTLFSVFAAGVLAAAATLALYLYKGAPPLGGEVAAALYDIAAFVFAVAWCAVLPVAMLAVVRILFGRCFYGFGMRPLACDGKGEAAAQERGALAVKVWRRWLFLIVWGVAVQVLAVAAAAYLSGGQEGAMAWFGIGWLCLFVLLAGGATLPLMAARCKMIGVLPC